MKKLLAAVLALCILLSISTVALAADDGKMPTAPVDGTPIYNTKKSSGLATVTGSDFDVTGDDDKTAADAADTTGADIGLWSRVAVDSNGGIVYKIDVTWGTMRFVFTRPARTWNPTTHTYVTSSDTTDVGWSLWDDNEIIRKGEGYTPFHSTYNRVMFVNHTNHAIKATYEFKINEGLFNATQTDPDRVTVSILEASSNNQVDGMQLKEKVSKQLTKVDEMKDWTEYKDRSVSEYTLNTAESFRADEYGGSLIADRREFGVSLVPSGTPDEDKTVTEYTRLGTLTITFEPDTERQGSYIELNGIPQTQTP